MTDRYALGLDLGGTKILAGLVDQQGQVRQQWRLSTPTAGGAGAILEALVEAVGTIRSHLGADEAERLVGVGVSTAGHVIQATGDVAYCTPNLPGWGGTPVGTRLREAHDLPVVVDNDGNCAAWGEYWLGAGQGVSNLVVLTLGTGLGAGIIANGQLVRGERGGGAEIGHAIVIPDGLACNCGQAGCLESYVSGTALAQAAKRSGLWSPAPSSHQLFEWARQGDERALGLVHEMARYLAWGLVTLISYLDPERVLIGGGVGEQADLFLPVVRAHLERMIGLRGWEGQRLQRAALGEAAGMIGAAGQALERFGRAGLG